MIEQILKDSAYKLSQFQPSEIAAVEKNIYTNAKGKICINCLIRDKEIQLKPEEVIRQLFICKLINQYGYKKSQIKVEYEIHFGHEKKRADIVVVNEEHPDAAYIIIEVKRPNVDSGEDQLKSYCHASGAPIAVWTNGEKIAYWTRQEPNIFIPLSDIPYSQQTLDDIQQKLWHFEDLKENDILSKGTLTLSKLIKELEDDILANAGVDSFEEVFKLIFTKLYDEKLSANDKNRCLHFRNYNVYIKGKSSQVKEENNIKNKKLAATIQTLFKSAKDKWGGVFETDDTIELTPSHLAVCISKLQNVKLFNSNLEVIDEAFEYLMNKSQKGEKGQYFTPRYVIDMCVRMLNPKENEFMIDTAAGSCGFPVHTIFHVWKSICKKKNLPEDNLFTAEDKPQECKDYVDKYIFAIDFDEKAVRVARTLNLIAGDGKTNVIRLNTLDHKRWGEVVNNRKWQKKYSAGWLKLDDLREGDDEEDYQYFNFDILMANPPFAGDVKEPEIIVNYKVAEKLITKKQKSDGEEEIKYQAKISRDVLFIERNLQFLKPGGRMAIVLPQGRFNNSSDKYIRDFIAERCRILAVVGLNGNVFKPHTGTKTSVLFVQKWDDKLCPRRDDYPIFFATMQKPSKDNSGEKIYATNSDGSLLRDKHNHLIVDHDLFNHDGLTADGIAEAFIEFAKKERLSFFDSSSFDEVHYKNLLKGLECTEIFLSELENNFTIGSEYYLKKYINAAKLVIQHGNYKTLNDISQIITDGDHGEQIFEDTGVLYLLSESVECGYIKFDKCRYINKVKHENLKRSCLRYGDVVLTKTGVYFGKSAVIPPKITEANTSSHVCKISLKSSYNPYFVSTFLNSDYGYLQLRRRGIKATRPEVSLQEICDVLVPIFSDDFQIAVEKVVISAHNKFETADEVYKSAEKLLAQALHLEDFKPSTENTAVVSFAQSFGKTGRLDAEFFMPKYYDLQKFLDNLQTEKLADVVTIFKSIEPGSDFYINEGLPFIRVSDVNKFGISEPDIKLSLKVDENFYPRKDTILFSKDGSVGLAYKVRENLTAVTSGALLHLTIKNPARILPDYLTLYLNSKLVQMLAERDCNGAIIQHWRISDIEKIPVPIIDKETQGKIAALVEKSFELRAESERLLEMAKCAVEIAIERGENVAIEYLGRGGNIGD